MNDINDSPKKAILEKIRKGLWILKGKAIAVLGLAFKPNTDDTRSSISIDLIKMLQAEGVKIKAYDPKAMDKAEGLLKDASFSKSAYDAAKGSDCLLIMTEWPEFMELDFGRIKKLMRQPFIVDGRNMYDPQMLKKMGFRYVGVGRR